jgi:hypothetical protein
MKYTLPNNLTQNSFYETEIFIEKLKYHNFTNEFIQEELEYCSLKFSFYLECGKITTLIKSNPLLTQFTKNAKTDS